MLKKRLITKRKKELKNESEKIWKGIQTDYLIVYVDQGDGEYYPVPLPVGELIQDLLHDVNILEKFISEETNKIIPGRMSTIIPVYIKNKDCSIVPARIDRY